MNLLLLATAPSLALALLFYLRDKYDREPFRLLTATFALGALSVIPVALIETEIFATAGFDIFTRHAFFLDFTAMVVGVAAVEELAKLAVVRGYVWGKKAFSEPYDGIIYTVMASLGFATVENINYVLQYGEWVGWLRALLTVPMHALTAVVMGYYIGLAKYPKIHGNHRYIFTGYILAVLLHAGFNTFISREEWVLVVGAPVIIAYLWYIGFRATQLHAEASPHKKSRRRKK